MKKKPQITQMNYWKKFRRDLIQQSLVSTPTLYHLRYIGRYDTI